MKQDHQDGPTLHNPEKLNEVDDDGLLPHSSKLASPKVRRAQRVEEGRPPYLDITRQNVKILQSRQTWSFLPPGQKAVAPVLSPPAFL